MRNVWTALSVLALASISGTAFAATAIPEPGVLELAGVGAAVAIAVAWAKKHRK